MTTTNLREIASATEAAYLAKKSNRKPRAPHIDEAHIGWRRHDVGTLKGSFTATMLVRGRTYRGRGFEHEVNGAPAATAEGAIAALATKMLAA